MSDGLKVRLQAALGSAYVIERELARGRTSRVFTATETGLGRRVVLKVLPPEIAANDPLARFRREILLASRLQHPHIVPVYAAGEADDICYFTMPFIEGDSLHERLERRGRLTPVEASGVLRDIGSALAYAHERGVVHRDVKPANIFMERASGRALLADFGVARALGEPDGLTQVGVTVGTPVYMSPEQVDGAKVDGRSDVYSLGLVGWEMLTGERPWAGESLYEVMHNQKFEPLPSLDAYGIAAPPALVAAIERAVSKDRSARPTAAAFVRALGAKPIAGTLDSSHTRVWRGETAAAAAPPIDQHAAPRAAPSAARSAATDPATFPAPATEAAWARRAAMVWDEPPRRSGARGRGLALAAAAVTMVVGAVVVGGSAAGGALWSHARHTEEEVAPLAASAPAAAEPETTIDVVADSAAAARLGGLEKGSAIAAITADNHAVHSAPVQYASRATPQPTRRWAPSHVDALRARAATASSALRAYQSLAMQYGAHATPRAPAAQGAGESTGAPTPRGLAADTAATSAAPAPARSDVVNQAATPAASTPAASTPAESAPAGSTPESTAPATGAPSVTASPEAANSPVAATDSAARSEAATEPGAVATEAPARAIRVSPVPAGTGPAHVTAPWCRPWFPGSHICRVYNPRTGKVDTYYRADSAVAGGH